jgi:hypothetical protein
MAATANTIKFCLLLVPLGFALPVAADVRLTCRGAGKRRKDGDKSNGPEAVGATDEGSTSLLAGLSRAEQKRLLQLKAAERGAVVRSAAATDSALDTWMQRGAQQGAADEGLVGQIGDAEHKARRSLMHR